MDNFFDVAEDSGCDGKTEEVVCTQLNRGEFYKKLTESLRVNFRIRGIVYNPGVIKIRLSDGVNNFHVLEVQDHGRKESQAFYKIKLREGKHFHENEGIAINDVRRF